MKTVFFLALIAFLPSLCFGAEFEGLSPYQRDFVALKKNLWFLENTGLPYRLYGYDHHWQELEGRPGEDIQLPKNAVRLAKKVRVAVIDSGVHPLHAFLDPFVQWSKLASYGATEIVSKPGEPAVEMSDSEGHGTFVAGIMTSIFRNLKLQNQKPEEYFEIIPIKLFNFGNERNLIENHIFDNFNKALLKALELKVDVIISSFSWPRFHEHPELFKTLELVAKNGIIFVGAAGNKVSRNLNYPCDSKFVLCVGGTNQQGEFAQQFSQPGPEGGSNYGLGVDVLAPAVNMVSSSSPQDLTTVLALNDNSPLYMLDGTSFSAPIVAAEAAILLSVFPSEKREQILSRIYLGTQSTQGNDEIDNVSVSMFGRVSFQKALSAKPRSLVLPQLKNRLTFVWDERKKKIPFSFQCINGPCPKSQVEIEYQQAHSNLAKLKFQESIEFSEGSERTLWLPLELEKSGSSRLDFSIKIYDGQNSRSFQGSLTAVQDNSKLRIEAIQLQIQQNLREPIAIYGAKSRQAILIDPKSETENIALVDYKNRSQKIKKIPNLIQIRFAFQRDLNHDGVDDLLLVGVMKNEKDPQNNFEALLYLDKDLNFLAEAPEPIVVDIPKGTWPADSSLFKWKSIRIRDSQLDVPAYIGYGLQSSSSTEWGLQPRAFLESQNASDPRRLWISFKYDSHEKQLKSIALTDYAFYKEIYKSLGLDPDDDFILMEALRADPKDHRALATVRRRASAFSVILEADEFFKTWRIRKSPLQAVLSGKMPTQFWHPEIDGETRTLILQEVNKYQMTVLYEDERGKFEFSLVDRQPIGYVIDVQRTGPALFVYTANDLTMKSWRIDGADSKAILVAEFRLDFMNFYENARQILTYDFPKANAKKEFEFVMQNAYWNGNEFSVLKSDHQGHLFKPLEASFALPSGCVVSSVLSGGNYDDDILGIAICIGKKNQHFILKRAE